jgi:hypothetical protein
VQQQVSRRVRRGGRLQLGAQVDEEVEHNGVLMRALLFWVTWSVKKKIAKIVLK